MPAPGARTYKHDFDLAILDFTEAIRLDPKDYKAFIGRGHIWSRKQEHAKAAADYGEAIKLEPGAAAYVEQPAPSFEASE